MEVANSEMPLSDEQSSEMVKEDGNKTAVKPSQVRTLSNGLVIEELEMGIKDGKIAASGKKVVLLNYLKQFRATCMKFFFGSTTCMKLKRIAD